MIDQSLPLDSATTASRAVHAVRPEGLAAVLAGLPAAQAEFARGAGFKGAADELLLLPGEGGVAAALLGLGANRGPFAFGGLPFRLPEGAWHLVPGDYDAAQAELGFLLGAYRYSNFKRAPRAPARLAGASHAAAQAQAAAIWMVRDLINTPANVLGPAELADAAIALAARHGAASFRIEGAELDRDYPTVAAVGRGSDRAPVVAGFRWQGCAATADSPLVSLCGKGVCFDSGGYDLKPSSGMLRMKKDMGGAANILGLARMIMDADLPVRLAVRIGAVENSVSGHAMRPLDVIRSRRGLTIEVGNTDAEGRLVLCDLLAEASDEQPAILIDCATLTGAARVAVGPDLPVLFATDEGWAAGALAGGTAAHDPLWRLPLWDGYDSWLDSPIADLNNVSTKAGAGAIVAALFMRRFLAPGTPWLHLDIYAWNDANRAGRPEGGEATGIRAVFGALLQRFAA